ncbi:MAG: hypothetical protein K0S47_4298 [Herbinix sp.]|jgi:glutaredoxin-related protein|nr:hypothetical protein [Herbinix sp.]
MKVIMYGTEICPDCVEAKEQLMKSPEIELDYRNITETITTLKEFLSYRDHDELFISVKEEGRVGIPFFLLEDGRKTFDVTDIIEVEPSNSDVSGSFCSIDGRGNC